MLVCGSATARWLSLRTHVYRLGDQPDRHSSLRCAGEHEDLATPHGTEGLYMLLESGADPRLEEIIAHRVHVGYNASPEVTILPPGCMPRRQGKAKTTIGFNERQKLIAPQRAGGT
jgi:hypothetical protein